MKNVFVVFITFLGACSTVNAQHDHSGMKDSATHRSHGSMPMKDMGGDGMNAMTHAISRNLPMSRNGSGTGWLPDASPMYGYMFHKAGWMMMAHGNIFLRYTNHDLTGKGIRGGYKFDAPNWGMLMAQRPVGKNGLFHTSIMLSLDPITDKSGYPLLFQSGETYEGKPLIDRQHPHDLISELSVSYAHALSSKSDLFIYAAYPGEPALGPVAFMHRPSALGNPDAPLSHHWVDATHITFGVVTMGARYGNVKLEASSFTGREPGENRYNFDQPRFDSWSGRLSYNPSGHWALQLSQGFIRSPETFHPGEDIRRTTASAIYSLPLRNKGSLDATALWGMNKVKDHSGEHATLVEASWRKSRLGVLSRYEWVQKSTEELALDETVFGHDSVFPVHAFTIGMNYEIACVKKITIAAGGQFTFYQAAKKLDVLYGKNPLAVEFFLRVYPGRMN